MSDKKHLDIDDLEELLRRHRRRVSLCLRQLNLSIDKRTVVSANVYQLITEERRRIADIKRVLRENNIKVKDIAEDRQSKKEAALWIEVLFPEDPIQTNLGQKHTGDLESSIYQHTFPPKAATYLLHYLPKEHRQDTIGDLEEEFQDIHDSFGYKRAAVWYWWQTIASIIPFVARGAPKLVRWATIGWIADIIRRFTS